MKPSRNPDRRVALTVRNVPTLKVGRWWDRGLPGFYVLVSPSSARYPKGVRSYGVWYRVRGRAKRASLGRHPVVTLAVARERARAVLVAAKVHGRDAGRSAAAAAPANLVELIERWLTATASEKAESTLQLYRGMLKAHVRKAAAGRLALDDIRRDDLRQLVAPLVDRSPSMALHVRRMIKAALAWGIREDLLERDPAAGWQPPVAEVSRERVLRDDELAALWTTTLEERGRGPAGVQRAGLARLLVLLMQRSGETGAMRWADIDVRGRLWLIPGEHRKGGRPHAVPLSDAAVLEIDALRPLTGDGARVFPWASPRHRHWARPLAARAARRGLVAHWTPHDLRRTGATGLARLGVSRSIIALVLGHEMREGGAVTSVYDRFDRMPERAAALDLWARHVATLAG